MIATARQIAEAVRRVLQGADGSANKYLRADGTYGTLSLDGTVVAASPGASYTPDLATGDTFILTHSAGGTLTINNPLNAATGRRWVLVVRNTNGASGMTLALGAAIRGHYLLTAVTVQPSTQIAVMFVYDGTNHQPLLGNQSWVDQTGV